VFNEGLVLGRQVSEDHLLGRRLSMHRGIRLALGTVVIVAISAGDAAAQIGNYPGYGNFGWGGWGGGAGSTPEGSIARGLGYYDIGAGIYNEDTAIANSVNEDTVARWNQYVWQSQQAANRREYLRSARRMQRDAQSGDAIYRRLRDHPTPDDIEGGAALNVVLDQLGDPRIQSSALRLATTPLDSKVIGDIPFQSATEAISLSLNQLTSQAWPAALQGEPFAPERTEYQQAIAQALQEDESDEGQITPATFQRVNNAVARIHAKLQANPPADRTQYLEAQNYLRTLYGMTRMLQNPKIERILAELEKTPKTTLGSLLGFMHTYNLRFGRATTPKQRAVYEQLYPLMVAHRDKILKDLGPDQNQNAAQTQEAGNRPPDFFQGMHLDHLSGRKVNDKPGK